MSSNLGLFSGAGSTEVHGLTEGATLLRGFASPQADGLMSDLNKVLDAAPLRHMFTAGGFRMSVAMSNCGSAGWITDRQGYRYTNHDPETSEPWPPMPESFRTLATSAAAQAGYPNFVPDACLINRYEPGARMTLHQDRNEQDFSAPIVSVSLGLPATFLFGGLSRKERPARISLNSGDVIVWGGPSRLNFHGINPLKDGDHPLTGPCRFNFTFRRAL